MRGARSDNSDIDNDGDDEEKYSAPLLLVFPEPQKRPNASLAAPPLKMMILHETMQ